MGKIWRLNKPVSFTEVGKNIFIVTFATHVDKQWVMDGKPWLFDNNLFALQALDGYNQIAKNQFITETFWIQLHNLFIMCMNRLYGNLLGKTISKVREVDVELDNIDWGQFLRVRVALNLSKP